MEPILGAMSDSRTSMDDRVAAIMAAMDEATEQVSKVMAPTDDEYEAPTPLDLEESGFELPEEDEDQEAEAVVSEADDVGVDAEPEPGCETEPETEPEAGCGEGSGSQAETGTEAGVEHKSETDPAGEDEDLLGEVVDAFSDPAGSGEGGSAARGTSGDADFDASEDRREPATIRSLDEELAAAAQNSIEGEFEDLETEAAESVPEAFESAGPEREEEGKGEEEADSVPGFAAAEESGEGRVVASAPAATPFEAVGAEPSGSIVVRVAKAADAKARSAVARVDGLLDSRPPLVRKSIGWLAIATLVYAGILWMYVMMRPDPDEPLDEALVEAVAAAGDAVEPE